VNLLTKLRERHDTVPGVLRVHAAGGIMKDIKPRAHALDLIGIQMYADIINLPRYLRESGWDGPYLVSEWGATGHWEVPKTEWAASEAASEVIPSIMSPSPPIA